MKRAVVLPIVAVIALVTGACSGSGGDASNATRESEPRPDATTDDSGLQWGTCANKTAAMTQLECATLTVPRDHSDPGAGTIEIEVARSASTGTPDERIGSLVLNPGGPGVSGIEFLAGAATTFPEKLTDRFDLVSFDPRGVAESTPLHCLTDEQREQQLEGDLTPDGVDDVDQLVKDQAELLEGCKASETALLEHVSTADVAADMDLLREALGDEQLTYMGFSYGTSVGATYATMFPANTRALVLDGSVSPDSSREEELLAQAKGFAKVYDSFVAACNASEKCPLAPDANARIDAVRTELEAQPLMVSTSAGDRELSADLFDIALATGLYNTTVWSPMASAIAKIDDGGGATLLTLVDQQIGRKPDGTFTNAADARAAINCADDTERPSVQEGSEAARRIAEAVPTFGRAVGWGMLSCLDWPSAANPTPTPTGEGAPPVLVVGTLGDPATPYEWSQRMADVLESGALLTYEGDGHTAFLSGGECIQNAVTDFLVDLKVPTAGTSCPAQDSGGFVSMRDSVIEQLTDSGIPETVATCIVDELVDELGEAQFEALILSNDPDQLAGLVTKTALGCATKG